MEEHRHFSRHAESFGVILQSSDAGTVDARCLDVSSEGMRISLKGPPLPEGSSVYAVVPEEKRSLFGARYLHGFVAYATRGVVGLWLGKRDTRSGGGMR